MNKRQLTDFAARYAGAWSSQNPGKLAAFYAEDGSLTVNAGARSLGRSRGDYRNSPRIHDCFSGHVGEDG
jgi:hypothetical protein